MNELPKWMLKYEGHDIRIESGRLIVDGIITDQEINLNNPIIDILSKIDRFMKIEKVREYLRIHDRNTLRTFDKIITYLNR